jgi:hypothetical protein
MMPFLADGGDCRNIIAVSCHFSQKLIFARQLFFFFFISHAAAPHYRIAITPAFSVFAAAIDDADYLLLRFRRRLPLLAFAAFDAFVLRCRPLIFLSFAPVAYNITTLIFATLAFAISTAIYYATLKRPEMIILL